MASTINPAEFDTKLAGLHDQHDQAQARRAALTDTAHRMAGDRKNWRGRRQAWGMSDNEAVSALARLAETGDKLNLSASRKRPSEILAAISATATEIAARRDQIAAMDAIYAQNPWNRYFPCMANNGHIHRTLACHTLYVTTVMNWRPDLSGKTDAEAVAELGEALCTVCFPGAPVAWTGKTLTQVERERTAAERNAAQAAREAQKAVKNLREDEQFRDHRRDRVTTVAACKQVLRDEVEYRDYYGRGEHPSHAEAAKAAETAKAVLLAREAARPGTGATQEEIDRIIANAVKANRKNGARI